MKKTLFTFLLFSTILSYSQKGSSSEKNVKEFLGLPLYVFIGYDKEYDEAVKFAFGKYWKASEVKYVNFKEVPAEAKATFEFRLMALQDYGKYYFADVLAQTKSGNLYGEIFNLKFDGINKGDSWVGTDRGFHDYSNKIIQYVILMNAQLKLCIEIGGTKYYYQNPKESTDNYTMMVQKEYIDNGLTEDVFKSNLTKIEFVKSDEIKARIIGDKIPDNCAQLFITQSPDSYTMFAVDLKTGKFLSSSTVGKTSFNRKKDIDDDVVKKLFKGFKK